MQNQRSEGVGFVVPFLFLFFGSKSVVLSLLLCASLIQFPFLKFLSRTLSPFPFLIVSLVVDQSVQVIQ